jgi:hypothetical protein
MKALKWTLFWVIGFPLLYLWQCLYNPSKSFDPRAWAEEQAGKANNGTAGKAK